MKKLRCWIWLVLSGKDFLHASQCTQNKYYLLYPATCQTFAIISDFIKNSEALKHTDYPHNSEIGSIEIIWIYCNYSGLMPRNDKKAILILKADLCFPSHFMIITLEKERAGSKANKEGSNL